jgi:hypothetical protein
MDPMLIKGEHHDGDYGSGQWVGMDEYHSHAQSPAQEFNGYSFISGQHGMPLEPAYNRPMPPLYSSPQTQAPLFSTTQWPSMLTNPSSHQPTSAPPVPPLAPIATYTTAHPLPPIAPPPASTPTARRTLTDQDRRRMCQYHEDNPTVKQTEIGGERADGAHPVRCPRS